MWLLSNAMGVLDLDPEKQKQYDELKKKYLKKPENEIPQKQIQPESHNDVINSLQKHLEQKQVTLNDIHSKDLLVDLKGKKQQLNNNIISKTTPGILLKVPTRTNIGVLFPLGFFIWLIKTSSYII